MSNDYNHVYSAMRNLIAAAENIQPNTIAEIIYLSIICIEQENDFYIEYYFGNPYLN